MANIHRPRKGSLQYWPRVRPKKETPVVKAWPTLKNISLLGFAGYKAGMTHLQLKDNRPNSCTKGDIVSWPVTILECPPLRVVSLRAYQQEATTLKLVQEAFNPRLSKELQRHLSLKRHNYEQHLKAIQELLPTLTDIRINVATQPIKTGLSKKQPAIFELGLGGTDIKAKLEYTLTLLDKDIHLSDVFKAGTRVDVHSVSKGKGFQGTVKRFGVSLRSHKSEKKRRGNIMGPERPGRVHWGMLMPGRLGYNTRTEYNKHLVFIHDQPEKINPKGGFLHYGLVKNEYAVIKGSVPGPAKRLIRINEPIRGQRQLGNLELVSISTASKQ